MIAQHSKPPVPAKSERPPQPEIPRSHFARGVAREENDYEELPLGRFSEGEEYMPHPAASMHRGRFSEGQEELGEADPEKHVRRRFSEGQEH